VLNGAGYKDSPKIAPRRTSPNPVMQTTAPDWLHPPVNHLHSIEKSEDTISEFSLTLKMKRVKRQSFFDSF